MGKIVRHLLTSVNLRDSSVVLRYNSFESAAIVGDTNQTQRVCMFIETVVRCEVRPRMGSYLPTVLMSINMSSLWDGMTPIVSKSYLSSY